MHLSTYMCRGCGEMFHLPNIKHEPCYGCGGELCRIDEVNVEPKFIAGENIEAGSLVYVEDGKIYNVNTEGETHE